MSEKRIKKTGVGFLIDASAKTYETAEKQIREFISNSLDARATKVKIEVRPDDEILILTDNGSGMTEEEFDENYMVIGCSQKYGDPGTIGRIGVGKFSAIPLCDTLNVRTRKAGMGKVFSASLNLKQLKDPDNRTKDITKLVLGKGNYVEPSVDDPDIEFSEKGSFTKMILKGIPEEVKRKFEDESEFEELCRELGKILPLKYNESSKGIQKLKKVDPDLASELIRQAKNRHIQVVIHTPHYPQGKEVFRSLFGDDFEIAHEEICGDVYPVKSPDDTGPAPIKIIGYLADMTTSSWRHAEWKGLNVRIQNTTVAQNSFFKFEDPPAAGRITGEIQISNVNEEKLITMNRSGFATSDPEYQKISDWLTKNVLEDFAKRYVRKRTLFNSQMKKKSVQLKNQAIVAESMEHAVREVFVDDKVDLALFSKGKLMKEDEINQEEALMNEFHDEIMEIIPVPPTAADSIEIVPIGGKFSIRVPENFLKYNVNIDGVEYELKYVNHKEEEPIIDIDIEERTIRIDP